MYLYVSIHLHTIYRYICMSVCMCVCACMCMRTHTYFHISYKYIYIYIYVYAYTYILDALAFVCICIYKLMYMCTYIHIYVWTYRHYEYMATNTRKDIFSNTQIYPPLSCGITVVADDRIVRVSWEISRWPTAETWRRRASCTRAPALRCVSQWVLACICVYKSCHANKSVVSIG